MIDPLRLLLLGGLVFHKVVWEVLKTRGPAPRPPAVPPLKKLVKLVKVGVLLFLVVQCAFLDVLPIPGPSEGRRAAGVVLFLLGLTVAVTGRIHLGRSWTDLEDFQVGAPQLVSHGIYRSIRHPIYTGDLLLVTGLELALNSWLVLGALAILVVVVRQIGAEEALLARTLPGYAEYQGRTKRLVPFLF